MAWGSYSQGAVHVGPPSKRLGVGDFHLNSLTKEAGSVYCQYVLIPSGNQALSQARRSHCLTLKQRRGG